MKLPLGKVPINVLEEVVFRNLGVNRKEVILGPSAGFDGAVIDVGDNSLIISMDPITGARERIGWLAVNINANDVATFGVEPAFLSSCILLSENTSRKEIETICAQMDKAARDLGIAIIGGHCETTPALENPIIIGSIIGLTKKGHYVTAGGSKPGDKLILTKSAGIEGTAILASDKRARLENSICSPVICKAREFFNQISVVKDALVAYESGGVNAMHDPTEGGVSGGMHEMAEASNVGFKIFEEKIPIQKETQEICSFFQIDPLQLASSGALLISASVEHASKIVTSLKQQKVPASIIGEITEKIYERIMVKKDGSIITLPTPLSDHLWLALGRE
ncbi:MAG: AIR synthase family protein [Candidatus Bathyarchaeota archaeon]|jgi:hydrogenase maturation factor